MRSSWARPSTPQFATIPATAFFRASLLGNTRIDLDIISGAAASTTSTLRNRLRTYQAATWRTVAVVEVRDSCANLRGRGGDTVAVYADGPGDVRIGAKLIDLGNGIYEAMVFAQIAGAYDISAILGASTFTPTVATPLTTVTSRTDTGVAYSAMHVMDSPWTAEFLPGVISRYSTSVTGVALVAGVAAGIPAHVILQTRDEAYNAVTTSTSAEALRFSATLRLVQEGSSRESIIASINIIGDDESMSVRYVVNFTLHTAGMYQLYIALDGNLISGMPQGIACHPGHTSASWSGVRNDIPRVIQAGALSTLSQRFILQAHDEFNNTIDSGGDMIRVQLRGMGLVIVCFDSERQRLCRHYIGV